MVRAKGLDKTKPEEYTKALKLFEDAKNCCNLAQKFYDSGNYIASIHLSAKRCSLFRQLFELLLKILGA